MPVVDLPLEQAGVPRAPATRGVGRRACSGLPGDVPFRSLRSARTRARRGFAAPPRSIHARHRSGTSAGFGFHFGQAISE